MNSRYLRRAAAYRQRAENARAKLHGVKIETAREALLQASCAWEWLAKSMELLAAYSERMPPPPGGLESSRNAPNGPLRN